MKIITLPKPEQLQKGASYKIHISHLISPFEFYLRIVTIQVYLFIKRAKGYRRRRCILYYTLTQISYVWQLMTISFCLMIRNRSDKFVVKQTHFCFMTLPWSMSFVETLPLIKINLQFNYCCFMFIHYRMMKLRFY